MTTPKPSELQQFERSYCKCDKCRSGCKAMPGMLSPGDIDNIAEYLGKEPDEEFVSEHFAASEGALVRIQECGTLARIPTIVPKQKENGECVFLTEDGRCGVHPVSPFGCRCFNICGEAPSQIEEDTHKSQTVLACIAGNIDYNMLHQWLGTTGHVARPLHQRKSHLMDLLEEAEE